jgi:hypothetical protein
MRVLLKEGADTATADSILVLPQVTRAMLETLSGEAVAKGVVAEVNSATLSSALRAGAVARQDQFVTAKVLQEDVRWLTRALARYEVGSKISLKTTSRGFALDDSEATQVDRAAGLSERDTIAVGPLISPKTFLNARAEVVSVDGDKVQVQWAAGDRDRIQRATGKELAERTTIPLACVEKVE